MRVWALKTCDTCRKAIKILQGIDSNLHVTDVRGDGVSPSDLKRFFEKFDAALLNQRSTTWRGLSDDEKRQDPITLLAQHPTLMKRPVIEVEGDLYLGWGKEVQEKLVPKD